jgi:hypothetical protein
MKAIEDFEGFREGREPPESFVHFVEFEGSSDDYVICDFELAPAGQEDFVSATDEAAGEHVAVFGNDGSHSLFAFWTPNGEPLATAPIVLLDSEGEGTGVLASSFDEFLSLIALGHEPLGRPDQWTEEECPQTARFQDWVRTTIGIEPAADANSVVEAARAAHPDFKSFVSEHQAPR